MFSNISLCNVKQIIIRKLNRTTINNFFMMQTWGGTTQTAGVKGEGCKMPMITGKLLSARVHRG